MRELTPAGQLPATQGQEITAALYDQFIKFVDVGPGSAQTYARALRQFTSWLQREGIRQPQRADVLRYREELKKDHKAATVQSYICAVRRFFQWTADIGIYPNIAEKVKGAKVSTAHKKDALTLQQAQHVLELQAEKDTPAAARDYAIILTGITCGLRAIEIRRANVEDLRTVGDLTILYVQGKGEEEAAEFVIIPGPVEKALRDYLQARGSCSGSDPLFASISRRNCGGRLTTRSISQIIKTALIDAGYNSDRLTAHSLRHTAGTLNLLAGGTLQETQQLLRHANINTTTIYAHNLDRLQSRSEQRITAALFDKTAGRTDPAERRATQ